MSRSHGSLVAARARPQVAAHALLDLVASASCLSPTQTPSQTHRSASQQLEPPLSGVEARSLGQKAAGGRELTLASAWPGSEGANVSAEELRWAEASLELQLQRAALSSRAIAGGGTFERRALERGGTPMRFDPPSCRAPTLPPRASTAAQVSKLVSK